MSCGSRPSIPDMDVELAACWVHDALEGRFESGSASMVGRPAWERCMYALNTNAVWEIVLQCVGFLSMLQAFFEPGYSLSGLVCTPPAYMTVEVSMIVLEGCGLAAFWLDIYAKLVYMGPAKYWLRSWHRFYLFVVVMLTMDFVTGSMCGQRPMRLLRPLLIGLRNREQRRILLSLLHLLSHQLGVAILSTLGVVAFAGAVGVHLFGASFDAGLAAQLANGGSDENHLHGTFNSFLHAAVEIWVLISSAENFLDLLLPAMRTPEGHSFVPLLAYFGPLLYFGYFFLMSVLLAVVVDEYLLTARRLVQQEHHRERKGLLEAFALLNPTKTGYVDVQTWTRLISYLRPGTSRREAILRFHMVAHIAPDRGVHVREFLRLHSNLTVDLVEEHAYTEPWLRALPDTLRLLLLLLNALIFVGYSPLQSIYVHRVLFAAHTAILPLLTLDRKSWTASRRWLNGGCLGIANVCAATYWTCDLLLHLKPPTLAGMSGQIALLLLLVQASWTLRLIMRLLSYVLPQFLAVSVSVFMIVYSFGIVGMQLFHNLPLTSADARYAHETLAGCEVPFGSLPCTLFVLFQVMTNEDWHVVLRAMWSAAGPAGLTFVLCFFLVVNVCLLSLTTALAINAFLASKQDLLDQGLLIDNADPALPVIPEGSSAATRVTSPVLEATEKAVSGSLKDNGGSLTSVLMGLGVSTANLPTANLPGSLRTEARRDADGSMLTAYESAMAAVDGDAETLLDDHQDLSVSRARATRTKLQLEAAERQMLEHEMVSYRAERRPALGRGLPRSSDIDKRADSRGPGNRSSTRSDLKRLAKGFASPQAGGSAIARAASGRGDRGGSSTPKPKPSGSPPPSRPSADRLAAEQDKLIDSRVPRSDDRSFRPNAVRSSLARFAGGCRSPGGTRVGVRAGAAGAGSDTSAAIEEVGWLASAGGGSSEQGGHQHGGGHQPQSRPYSWGDGSGASQTEVDIGHAASADSLDIEASSYVQPPHAAGILGSANAPPSASPLLDGEEGSPSDQGRCSGCNGKWRVASRTVTMFSRRAAAGLMHSEEPLDVEEEAAIRELTQHSGEHRC